jgi:hypothetical protein
MWKSKTPKLKNLYGQNVERKKPSRKKMLNKKKHRLGHKVEEKKNVDWDKMLKSKHFLTENNVKCKLHQLKDF